MITESPLKMMKNAFYFTLKALFVLKILKFLSSPFGHVEKTAQQKDKVNFKIHDEKLNKKLDKKQLQCTYCPISQEVKATNQAMKFGQLIEYNMRNIFVEKSYTKRAGETIPRPLSKKSKLSITLDQ